MARWLKLLDNLLWKHYIFFMSNRQKSPPDHVNTLRSVLQRLAKNKLRSREDIANAAKKTSLSKTHIGQMTYQGKGGMDAWAELLFYLYDLSPTQVEALFAVAVKNLKKSEPASEAQLAFENLANRLSEDEVWFWSSLIHAAHDIKPSFSIRKNKK